MSRKWLSPLFENIPFELKELNQWVNWKLVWNEEKGKFDKVPFSPLFEKGASTTDDRTWTYFDYAEKYYRVMLGKEHTHSSAQGPITGPIAGVGFVLTRGIVGLDLDKCIDENGNLEPWAQKIVDTVQSYTEYSPSGTGLRILVKGKLPGKVTRHKSLEMYEKSRYLTITGRLYGNSFTQMIENQNGIDAVYNEFIGQPKRPNKSKTVKSKKSCASTVPLDDEALLEKARSAKNGDKFARLWEGDLSDHDDDASRADLALCCLLAFWTGKDAEQMDRLFRQCNLFRPEKWDDPNRVHGKTYGEATIDKAIENTGEIYEREGIGGLTKILFIDSELPAIVDTVLRTMMLANVSGKFVKIFQRHGLVRIGTVPYAPTGSGGTFDHLQIIPLELYYLTKYLMEIIHWEKDVGTEKEPNIVPHICPHTVTKTVLKMPGEWKLPFLKGIINAPTMRPNGTILTDAGWDCETCLYYDPCGVEFPEIPENPDRKDAEQALTLLLEILSEFPFKTDADRSVALALILTTLVRSNLRTAPIFGISAATMGTGKTLLATVASLIAFGHDPALVSYTPKGEELQKLLFALLLQGAGIICIDNVEQPLANETLCSMLTSDTYTGRILCKSESSKVQTNATFTATGNNLSFKGDLATRALLCQMDAAMEFPGDRTFKRNLYDYIPAHRPELVSAGLTLLRAYFIAQDKPQLKPFGRFEEWSNLIRGAIVWLGLADPLNTRREVEANDPAKEALRAVLMAWYARYASEPALAKDAMCFGTGGMELSEALKAAVPHKGELTPHTLGTWLRMHKERRVDGLRFTAHGGKNAACQWQVLKD